MKNKLFLAGILIICIITAISVLFHKQREQEMEKARSIQEKMQAVSAERIIIAKKTKEATVKKEMFLTELNRHDQKIQGIQTDISDARLEKEELDDQLSQKRKVISKLEDRLDLALRQESALEAQLDNAKSDYQETVDEIGSLREEKVALEEKIKSRIPPPKGVELKKIVVRLTPPLEGKILEVNKEYNFVVIDLGIGDNVKNGDLFNIYREGQLIAIAAAENIYEEMSSVTVLDEWLDVPILNGDTVRLVKP